MDTKDRTSMSMERLAFTVSAESNGGVSGRATPYGIPDGRAGRVWAIDADGFPELKRYASTVFEPGVFSDVLASDRRSQIRFLYQHGDAGQGWEDSPMGINALPIGTITQLEERDDG